MSGRPKNSKKKDKDKPKPRFKPVVVWSVRGAVLAVAAILLSLAWHEFQVRQEFSATNEAWQNALRSKPEDVELTRSEFSRIPVQGHPAVISDKAEPNSFSAVTVETFTWKGRMRSYAVKVYFGLGNDPPVEQIEVVGSGQKTTKH